MSLKSVYLPADAIDNNRIRVSGDEHRHLVVARVDAGETIEIFDGAGTVWRASVEAVGKRESVVRLIDSRQVFRDPFDVILGLSLIRTAAFEVVLEKAVELGVTRIIPFAAARSNVPPADRHERWMRIIVEAAKQSKHYFLPVLDAPTTFSQVVNTSAASKIMFAERAGGPLKSALNASPVLYLIGPEGGWTDGELAEAERCGFQKVSLGKSILRAETAAIVGAALIRYELER
jgi:16S rRNA (uracil1498-N3)-methyltransferase